MVFDLTYYSHPNKLLEKHILGVLSKSQKRDTSKITEFSVLFHDLGKMNPNFQAKLKPENSGKSLGYSDHAYLSAYVFLFYAAKNQSELKTLFGFENTNDLRLLILKLSVIIAKHHGNLPNFEDGLNKEKFEEAERFIDNHKLPFSDFFRQKLAQIFQPFDVKSNPQLWLLTRFIKEIPANWQKNALKNFNDVQFSFASLIEADKRDAGDTYLKDYYNFDATIKESISELSLSLEKRFLKFSLNDSKSNLDILRTEIRETSVNNIKPHLNADKRIFTLTAPTGAGKTYSLLALAVEIQKIKGNLGIIYSLPFLSITEQVEGICKDLIKEVLSINSKSVNERIENDQESLDATQNQENIEKLLQGDFIQQTFDHPFIITTFVQFFESFLSNRNSTLLKLPNFSNRIFLIDEVQALPPRLYIFFTAWLDEFCRENNSYVIISTATMPKMDLKGKNSVDVINKPELLFKNYKSPIELLPDKRFFEADTFNRYKINYIDNQEVNIERLVEHILSQSESCLVILNTIKDSKALFNLLKNEDNVYLLNTHFTTFDRRKKIKIIQEKLKTDKIILVSTQLIEAGVDIDFPIVYRDLCPLPSLIQSAGRCNRNKKTLMGQVYFFHLLDDNGKSSSEKVYRKEAKRFLQFCKENIKDGIQEKQLFKIQSKFFQEIADELSIGEAKIGKEDKNLIACVNSAEFETLGQFKLINEADFGFEWQYYIPENDQDMEYEKAIEMMFQMVKAEGYAESKKHKIMLNQQLKKIADRTITIRTFSKNKDETLIPLSSNKEKYFDIRVLANLDLYSFEKGFEHDSINNSFL
jgi:CRISPR-associated endonuclease/helicase Cas3